MNPFSRPLDDDTETPLLKDVAFNRHSINEKLGHTSPFSEGRTDVGVDNIVVKLVQGIDEESFRRTAGRAVLATIGIDPEKPPEELPWEEMLKGGLQTALETQTIVFEVSGVSRTCTHQLVRSRRAAFHQQSQRASYMGDAPNMRMPESIWRNELARLAFILAIEAARQAYDLICQQDISYQDARFVLPEGTETYIMLEYPLREFLAVYSYRACSMFQWEIVTVMRKARDVLVEAHPWLDPYIRISCQTPEKCKTCEGSGFEWVTGDPAENSSYRTCTKCGGSGFLGHKCTFQGWENVEGQCDFPWAKQANRVFLPDPKLRIGG